MKKRFIYAGIAALMLVFGFGVANATSTWSDDNVFTGTTNWFQKSIKIGQQGTGGVTFFNGTIVNETTNDGADNPVTFGDNVRIDGEIYRTEKGGTHPVKITDTLIPTTNNAYDLGNSSNKFQDAYFTGTVNVGAIGGAGVISTANLADDSVTSDKIADDSVDGNKIPDSAVISASTIYAANSLSTNGNATINGGLDLNNDMVLDGNIYLSSDSSGSVYLNFLYRPIPSAIVRSFGYLLNSITATRNDIGDYTFDFNSTVNTRYLQVSPSTNLAVMCSGLFTDADSLNVKCYDDNGNASEQYVYVSIF